MTVTLRAVGQLDAALVADREDRADEVLAVAHAARDAVHDDADLAHLRGGRRVPRRRPGRESCRSRGPAFLESLRRCPGVTAMSRVNAFQYCAMGWDVAQALLAKRLTTSPARTRGHAGRARCRPGRTSAGAAERSRAAASAGSPTRESERKGRIRSSTTDLDVMPQSATSTRNGEPSQKRSRTVEPSTRSCATSPAHSMRRVASTPCDLGQVEAPHRGMGVDHIVARCRRAAVALAVRTGGDRRRSELLDGDGCCSRAPVRRLQRDGCEAADRSVVLLDGGSRRGRPHGQAHRGIPGELVRGHGSGDETCLPVPRAPRGADRRRRGARGRRALDRRLAGAKEARPGQPGSQKHLGCLSRLRPARRRPRRARGSGRPRAAR